MPVLTTSAVAVALAEAEAEFAYAGASVVVLAAAAGAFLAFLTNANFFFGTADSRCSVKTSWNWRIWAWYLLNMPVGMAY